MNQLVRMFDVAKGQDLREPPPETRVPLVKAGPSTCRYIIGEPRENAICCGAPTDGRSWCAWHRRIVFETRSVGRPR